MSCLVGPAAKDRARGVEGSPKLDRPETDMQTELYRLFVKGGTEGVGEPER